MTKWVDTRLGIVYKDGVMKPDILTAEQEPSLLYVNVDKYIGDKLYPSVRTLSILIPTTSFVIKYPHATSNNDHEDIMTWKRFLHYCALFTESHKSGQWCQALIFPLLLKTSYIDSRHIGVHVTNQYK